MLVKSKDIALVEPPEREVEDIGLAKGTSLPTFIADAEKSAHAINRSA